MRHIASEMFADEYFGSLPMTMRVLWIGIIAVVADDQGRFVDNAALIRSLIFPYDAKITMKDIDNALAAFHKSHKIERYTFGVNGSGKKLIQIVNWWKYQRSTQWAQESIHPAPPKWTDRVRIHKPGNGNVPYTLNWDGVGGYVQPTKAVGKLVGTSYKGDRPKPRPTPRPTPTLKPPPTPSAQKPTKGTAKTGGGGKSLALVESSVNAKFTDEQRKRAEQVKPILSLAGLKKEKLENTAAVLAVRSSISNANLIPYVLAALASSYADPDAKNKAAVAAYRIETDSVSLLFTNRSTWKVIPEGILKAAGISVAEVNNAPPPTPPAPKGVTVAQKWLEKKGVNVNGN